VSQRQTRQSRENAGRDSITAPPLAVRSSCAPAQEEDTHGAPQEINADMLAFWNGKGSDPG
jgi:hypothetical protein